MSAICSGSWWTIRYTRYIKHRCSPDEIRCRLNISIGSQSWVWYCRCMNWKTAILYLSWKERTEQRVEAGRSKVRNAEVHERQFFTVTHRAQVDKAATRCTQFSSVVRCFTVLPDRQCRAGQTEPLCYRVTCKRRWPDHTVT